MDETPLSIDSLIILLQIIDSVQSSPPISTHIWLKHNNRPDFYYRQMKLSKNKKPPLLDAIIELDRVNVSFPMLNEFLLHIYYRILVT